MNGNLTSITICPMDLKEPGRRQGDETPEHSQSYVRRSNQFDNTPGTSKPAPLNDLETGTMGMGVQSPCVGICSTVYGDQICRGCKRSYLEVIDWNRYEDAQKKSIHQRLQQQIERIVSDFIVIEDAQILKTQLDKVALRTPLYNSPLYWAHELLRLKAVQIPCLSHVGLRAKPPYETLTANALFTEMDERLFSDAR